MSSVQNLSLSCGHFDVHIPHWEIPDEGVSALIGPSGSGKTTVMRALLGLRQAPGMSWNFRGQDLAKLDVAERRLGAVFQSLEVFPHLSVEEHLRLAMRARGVESEQAVERMEAWIHELGLGAVRARVAGHLSGGEKQRLALAQALIGEPRVLFLDEPFSSLDRDLRKTAREWVQSVVQRVSIPVILITHDWEDVEALADRIFRLEAGRLKPGFELPKSDS